jgi:histidyl-tRNA synthetase
VSTESTGESNPHTTENPVGLVRGTRDWLIEDYARLRALESSLLDGFARHGYRPIRTPLLEHSDLHERKSGAGIVAKLEEVADSREGRVCLRPELTAGIVRAYVEAADPPALPWRVCMSGPVFRHQSLAPGLDREFTQVGVERIGDGGPAADAEVLWLADWSLRTAGIAAPRLRIGHVGLILEMLERSGLPHAVRVALVEVISEAAAEGRDVRAVETALDRLSGWLLHDDEGGETEPGSIVTADTRGLDRLFRHLVPDVTGRRSRGEILARLRRKWELGRSLRDVLRTLHDQVHELASLRGPAASVVDRLRDDFRALAPDSVAELLDLVANLDDRGIDHDRVTLDMGFGRGLGFYTQMIFEITADTPEGPVELGGGGRYDGLARVLGSDRDDRGAGFALGLERLRDALDRNPRP